MAGLFLDAQSKTRIAEWLEGIDSIPGINPGRLGMLQLAGSDYVSLKELVILCNFMPSPLVNVIMDAESRVRELTR